MRNMEETEIKRLIRDLEYADKRFAAETALLQLGREAAPALIEAMLYRMLNMALDVNVTDFDDFMGVIKSENSIERLMRIETTLKEKLKREDRNSPDYKDKRDVVVRLLIAANTRKNELPESQIDIQLDDKRIRPPSKGTKDRGIYRVQARLSTR